jgi:hypothetical protein
MPVAKVATVIIEFTHSLAWSHTGSTGAIKEVNALLRPDLL